MTSVHHTHSRLLPAALVGAVLASCSLHNQVLTTKVWPVINPADPRGPHVAPHPEQPILKKEYGDKLKVGLAFSGGGTVSSTATAGELAALKKLGFLDNVGYISSVSGGTWGALPYIYLSPEAANTVLKENGHPKVWTQNELDDCYLGNVTDPARLTSRDFDEQRDGSAVKMACNTGFSLHLLNFRGDESFAHMASDTFLKPVGIGDESRFFTWTRDYLAGLRKARYGDVPGDDKFYFAAPHRPFLIANTALERKQRTSFGDKIWSAFSPAHMNSVSNGFQPAEITPMYSGLWIYTDHRDPNPTGSRNGFFPEYPAGGGYVESFAYDSRFVGWKDAGRGYASVRLLRNTFAPRRSPEFSLGDACAASGSAPAAALGSLVEWLGLRPAFNTFPVWKQNPKRAEKNYPHADGGACDNTGLAALLARGVTHAVVFLNCASAYEHHKIPNKASDVTLPKDQRDDHYSPSKYLDTMVTSLFGKNGKDNWRNTLLDGALVNHVLEDDGDTRLAEMDRAFAKCAKDNVPLVYCADYTTTTAKTAAMERADKNHGGFAGVDHYGVPTGQRVRICWVYLTARMPIKNFTADDPSIKNDPWLSRLQDTGPGSTVHLFCDEQQVKNHHLQKFPALPTFGPSGKGLQNIDIVAANGLRSYAAFNIMHKKSQETIGQVLKAGSAE